MKVIFLDIDGVLNSYTYDRQRSPEDGNIDKTRLELLKFLTDKTNAKIVLTSSWREHWDKEECKRDEKGALLADTFMQAGLDIYDKTPFIGYLKRADEIRAWLSSNPQTKGFVIFDDNVFGWGDLAESFIQTNYRIGRGLEEEHIQKALELLSQG